MKLNYKLFLLFILSVIYTVNGFSQVEVTTYYENNDVVFDAQLKGQGSHTLVLKFSDLQGYQSLYGMEAVIPIKPGFNSSVYKLRREGNGSTYYRYSYTYYQGKYNIKPNLDYPYLLPAFTGKKLIITKYENIKYKFERSETDSILGMVFNYKNMDTVCAIRSGYIINIEYSERENENSEKAYLYYDKLSQNVITVEHNDGSLARYICITPVKILKETGDRIIVGQPLAVFTREESFQRVGIHLFYLPKNLKYKVIMPKFYTDEGLVQLDFGKEYVSISTREIIEKELTKKEKKELQK